MRDYQHAIDSHGWSAFRDKYRLIELAPILQSVLEPFAQDWHGAALRRLHVARFDDVSDRVLIVPHSDGLSSRDPGNYLHSLGDLFERQNSPDNQIKVQLLPILRLSATMDDLRRGVILCPA